RSRARDAGGRIAELEERLREQEKQLSAREEPAPAKARKGRATAAEAKAAAAEDDERKRRGGRSAGLKGPMPAGNEGRAGLPGERADAGPPSGTGAVVAEAEPEVPSQPDAELAPDESLRVRGVMVPRFARAAENALRDLPGRVVRDALRVVADLCSGEASAWR